MRSPLNGRSPDILLIPSLQWNKLTLLQPVIVRRHSALPIPARCCSCPKERQQCQEDGLCPMGDYPSSNL
jgi:hypothetical protein